MAYDGYIWTRRNFAGAAIACAGLVAGGRALAAPALTAAGPIGPFYPIQRPIEDDADMTLLNGRGQRALGEVIEVMGRVLDRKGDPISGATLELWQCNAAGRYAHPADTTSAPLDPNFQGFATLRTGAKGEWHITTIKPAGYESPNGRRTPHIHFDVRGHQNRLITQMYFSDNDTLNSADTLYNRLGASAKTALSVKDSAGRYRWDIVLSDS